MIKKFIDKNQAIRTANFFIKYCKESDLQNLKTKMQSNRFDYFVGDYYNRQILLHTVSGQYQYFPIRLERLSYRLYEDGYEKFVTICFAYDIDNFKIWIDEKYQAQQHRLLLEGI